MQKSLICTNMMLRKEEVFLLIFVIFWNSPLRDKQNVNSVLEYFNCNPLLFLISVNSSVIFKFSNVHTPKNKGISHPILMSSVGARKYFSKFVHNKSKVCKICFYPVHTFWNISIAFSLKVLILSADVKIFSWFPCIFLLNTEINLQEM